MMAAIGSEDELLALVAERFPKASEHVVLGRGDDCAELACPGRLALSTDLFIEDVHFRSSYFSGEEIGHKALAVNLSDLAAAGARPLAFSLGLMLPPSPDRDHMARILDGMAALAARYGCVLCGGDISRAQALAFSVTVWGESHRPDGCFLRRAPVRPGDVLIACGEIGLARAGLLALETEGRAAMGSWPEACRALLLPQPLLEAGAALAKLGQERPACRVMDLSDGLARDLPRLLCGCGAELTLDRDSLHPELMEFCRLRELDPLETAFRGGDDYGLLLAVDQAYADAAMAAMAVTCTARRLGEVVARPGIRLNGRESDDRGFDHFQT